MNTTAQQPQQRACTNGSVHRARICQLITSVATTTGEPRPLIWQRIYTRLETAFGVRIHQLPRYEGECLLTVAEHHGLMNEVYSLAFAEHLYLQTFEE